MGWSRPDEDSRADHFRDQHKHDWRPGDKPEPRPDLPEPSLLAIECALMVRHQGIKLQLAAQLIEEFARAEYQRIRLEACAAGANS